MKECYKIALAGGLVISLVPAWVVSVLSNLLPSLKPEELEVVSEFMSSGIGPLQIIFFMLITFLIPIAEEVVFRKILWGLFEWKLTPYQTWIFISLIFALIHIGPLHVLGLLPFSFFVGWLRYKTGKIGPSILAHVVNNGVACLLMII